MTHIDSVTQNIQLVSSLFFLLVNYFHIPVFSTSFNHLTACHILLEGMINNGKFSYSNTHIQDSRASMSGKFGCRVWSGTLFIAARQETPREDFVGFPKGGRIGSRG